MLQSITPAKLAKNAEVDRPYTILHTSKHVLFCRLAFCSYFCDDKRTKNMGKAQRQKEIEEQKRATAEIDKFFGGWKDDKRTTEEILAQIREGRNPKVWFPSGK